MNGPSVRTGSCGKLFGPDSVSNTANADGATPKDTCTPDPGGGEANPRTTGRSSSTLSESTIVALASSRKRRHTGPE